jgi:hypothetical protein
MNGEEPKISVDDIFYYLIGSNATGHEPIDFYKTLKPVSYSIDKDEYRQIREMLIFLSQLSVLKVNSGYLYLDAISDDSICEMLDNVLKPMDSPPLPQKTEEYLSIAKLSNNIIVPAFNGFETDNTIIEFIEGKRKRIEHFKIERSPLLRKYFIARNAQPVCAACNSDMSHRYPWTDYMLDIHHLLPLSSSIAIATDGTSLSDIVGICPSCHRAIHIYYNKWLRANHQDDFTSIVEAKEVFTKAIKEIN